MIINVTKDHIKNGKRMHSSCCPIALAVNEAVGGTCSALVGYSNLALNSDIVRELPEEARRFAMEFDYCKPVAPFSFEIDLDNLDL